MAEMRPLPTIDALPRIRQELKLVCTQCRAGGVYDVGRIMQWPTEAGESPKFEYGFSTYFRCRECGSPGPWEIVDHFKLLAKTVKSVLKRSDDSIIQAKPQLFDGTTLQTPAMGEEYLRRLIHRDPNNAFLRTRLANLYRSVGLEDKSQETYAQAVGLDQGDVEARYHLFGHTVEKEDAAAALIHGPLLVRHLLAGRNAGKDAIEKPMAESTVRFLLDAPEEFEDYFLTGPGSRSSAPEAIFIRSVLEQGGDWDEIVEEAAERLIRGEAAPAEFDIEPDEMDEVEEGDSGTLEKNLVPSLLQVVKAEGFEIRKIRPTIVVRSSEGGENITRTRVVVTDGGKKGAIWEVPSLRQLFRGDRKPPPDMDHYPEEYARLFYLIESHFMTLCEEMGDRTDQETEEVYATLRRRPDGKSLGRAHDAIWQASAFLLGTNPLSEAEFTAIFSTLEHSVRRWAQSPVSRNYIAFLRKSFAGQP